MKECELYDLRRDMGERVNVISQHPEVVKDLTREAEVWRDELGDDLTGRQERRGEKRVSRLRQLNKYNWWDMDGFGVPCFIGFARKSLRVWWMWSFLSFSWQVRRGRFRIVI